MKEQIKVFVSSRSFGLISKEAVEILKSLAVVERSTFGRPLDEKELMRLIPNYDAIIVGVDPITKEVLESSQKLKVVAKHGAGVDNIDLKAATEAGVVVTYVPGVNADSVADFSFCLMLALARKLIPAHMSTKAGEWKSKQFMGTEIYGKTLGIIGLGSIGTKVAERASGFNIRIICNTNHPERHQTEAKKLNIEFVDLKTLLQDADVVSIHCALTPQTRGLIGEKELKLMKKGSFLINTARGSIVVEEALYKALKEKWIAGAGSDVFKEEPPRSDCNMFRLENFIATPHIASYTKEAIANLDLIQAQDILKALQSQRPEFVANPEVLKNARTTLEPDTN